MDYKARSLKVLHLHIFISAHGKLCSVGIKKIWICTQ